MAGDYLHIVCSMCGDVGFPDKLFRCSNCHNRYQHSYCSNYYSEAAVEPIEKCNWCKSEEINEANIANTKHAGAAAAASSSRKSSSTTGNRSEYSGGKIKQKEEISPQEKGDKKSPRTGGGTRRYKLLKDVTC